MNGVTIYKKSGWSYISTIGYTILNKKPKLLHHLLDRRPIKMIITPITQKEFNENYIKPKNIRTEIVHVEHMDNLIRDSDKK